MMAADLNMIAVKIPANFVWDLTPGITQLLAMDWMPKLDRIVEDERQYWRITVPALDDFAVFAESPTHIWNDYPGALESHLRAYLLSGKRIGSHAETTG